MVARRRAAEHGRVRLDGQQRVDIARRIRFETRPIQLPAHQNVSPLLDHSLATASHLGTLLRELLRRGRDGSVDETAGSSAALTRLRQRPARGHVREQEPRERRSHASVGTSHYAVILITTQEILSPNPSGSMIVGTRCRASAASTSTERQFARRAVACCCAHDVGERGRLQEKSLLDQAVGAQNDHVARHERPACRSWAAQLSAQDARFAVLRFLMQPPTHSRKARAIMPSSRTSSGAAPPANRSDARSPSTVSCSMSSAVIRYARLSPRLARLSSWPSASRRSGSCP